MKKIYSYAIFAVVFVASIFLLFGCNSKLITNSFDEVDVREYYEKSDFQSITIGKSTFWDIPEKASTESMQITSYGGVCEYPMQNGGYIRIKFYGKDLIVGAIEEIDIPAGTDSAQ